MEYKLTNEFDAIVENLLETENSLAHINELGVTVGIMKSRKEKAVGKKTVYGDCSKVQEKVKEFVPYDFLITIYETNCMKLNPDQMKILLFHELLHIGAEATKDGGVRKFIIPHCIEEFEEVRERFGLEWDKPQTLMDFMEGEE